MLADRTPLVSVVLTTRDRPRLLPVALACYRQQTYPHRELIVVDDGGAHPASLDSVATAGGRLIGMVPDTPLGAKLNAGIRAARGALCQKMDDDDWYALDFLERMVNGWLRQREQICRPAIACLQPFLVFDVRRWEIRHAPQMLAVGATFLFAREDWAERPFRAVRRDDDAWFMADQSRLGRIVIPVAALDSFLSVRHCGGSGERGHTWNMRADGQPLEQGFTKYELYERRPEDLLPEWALSVYRDLHRNSPMAQSA